MEITSLSTSFNRRFIFKWAIVHCYIKFNRCSGGYWLYPLSQRGILRDWYTDSTGWWSIMIWPDLCFFLCWQAIWHFDLPKEVKQFRSSPLTWATRGITSVLLGHFKSNQSKTWDSNNLCIELASSLVVLTIFTWCVWTSEAIWTGGWLFMTPGISFPAQDECSHPFSGQFVASHWQLAIAGAAVCPSTAPYLQGLNWLAWWW